MHNNLKDITSHSDNRGKIQMILENCKIGSISRIETLANNWRARHYHPNDYHFCEVISGEIEYYHRPTGSNEKPFRETYRVGDIFYTPPKFDHEMIFNVDTVFNCYSRLPRTEKNYEKETIRIRTSLKSIYDNWKD